MKTTLRPFYIAAVMAVISLAAFAQGARTDLTGTWAFTVETSAGSGAPAITLKQDGEKLTGHYSGQLGEADLTGSVKGQDVKITFTVDVQGTMINCVYT